MQFFESLQRFVVVAESLVDKAKVVDGLDAVGLDTNSLEEELLSAVEVLIDKQSVALVDESLGVVAVVLDG